MDFIVLLVVAVLGVVGMLIGATAFGSLIGGDLTFLLRRVRGVPTEVRCPRTGQMTHVRIVSGAGVPSRVLWCDRFPDGDLHCHQPCFAGSRGKARVA